ncbi:hypothetical protein, partial [Nostoc sp. 'Peltigera membranacea cyanobiont' 232]|uniref:hypothetical protein n=1 Tax=Nostoc sp. 'Peltigera membranacea cyanobiont' 232 TaxID=2014531 RepID=UPI000B9F87D8
QIYLINPNISDIAASAFFTAFKEFQKSQQIRAFFSHQRHKRALILVFGGMLQLNDAHGRR